MGLSLDDVPDGILVETARVLNGRDTEHGITIDESEPVTVGWAIPERGHCADFEPIRERWDRNTGIKECGFEASRDEIRREVEERDMAIECRW